LPSPIRVGFRDGHASIATFIGISLDFTCGVANRGHMKKSKRVLGAKALQPAQAGSVVSEAANLRPRTEVSVREAKDQLSALLQRAQSGEEIVVTSDGEPVAMIVRHRPKPSGRPWASLATFRASLPPTPDSAGAIDAGREERIG
jgi:prevent-host-death family protein